MTIEHDEALVERVAIEMKQIEDYARGREHLPPPAFIDLFWMERARAVIYPPAPPKTRLQVARELLAQSRIEQGWKPDAIMRGAYDNICEMQAILAALALPAMED